MSLPNRQSVRSNIPRPPSAIAVKPPVEDAAPYAEVVEDGGSARDWPDSRINPVIVGLVAVLVGLTAFAVFTFLF